MALSNKIYRFVNTLLCIILFMSNIVIMLLPVNRIRK